MPHPAKEDAALVPGPVMADPDALAQDGLHPDPVSLDRPRGDRSGRDEVDERTVVEHEVGSADVVGREHARGEVLDPPAKDAPAEDWLRHSHMRTNAEGEQREWWNHRFGCRKWFLALRNRTTNEASETYWPEGIQA